MVLSHLGHIVYGQTEETHKKLRYAAVSVVFFPIGQILIQVLGRWRAPCRDDVTPVVWRLDRL